jgi:outer membrane protein OmpA-like peptidoglycan-associated protein
MGAELLRALRWLMLPALLAACGGAGAQQPAAGAPATSQMIEALKPGLTRSARNLVVRQKVDEPAVAASAPPEAPPVAPAAVAAAAAAAEPLPSLSLAIQFELNSARVRPESGPLLGNLVAALQSPDLKANRFLIEGHTDASGSAGANQKLSQERAEEVRLYLVALGVHPSRLRAVGKGSSDLADPLNPLASLNRRVRVVTQP